jgi:histidinol-phosphate aminotransferase
MTAVESGSNGQHTYTLRVMGLPPGLESYWEQHAGETSAYWARVCTKNAIDPTIEPDVYPWSSTPILADLWLGLILHGNKRSTAHPVLQHELGGDPPHSVGDYSIVLDGFARPACVLRTTSVEIKPFCEVDEAFVRAESEGGGIVAYWKVGHWASYEPYCALGGVEMSEDVPMVYEYFELIDPS